MVEFDPLLAPPTAGRPSRHRFGPKLRALRLATHTTLQRLSRQMGISITYLHHLETGQRVPPTIERIQQIARLLSSSSTATYNTLHELVSTAALDRGEFTLPIALDSSPARLRCLTALVLHWEKMSDAELDQLEQVLMRHQ